MLKFAVRNLMSRPMRSLLSLLGLTVAIMGMVGLFSVARGHDQMISETFGGIPGLIAMQPGAPIPLFSRLPADWGDEIAAVPGVSVVSSEIWQRVNIIDGKMTISPPRFLFGIDIVSRQALRQAVYRDNLVKGHFLNADDVGTRNIVVSTQIAEEFHKGVGDTLRVNGNDMPIVGIYHCGSLMLDVAIIVDVDQLREIVRFDVNSVCAFYIEADEGVDNDVLAERIRTLFHGRQIDRWQPSSALTMPTGDLSNPILDFFRQLDRKLKSLPAPAETQPDEKSPAGKPEAANENPTFAPSQIVRLANKPAEVKSKHPPAAESKTTPDENDLIEVRSAADFAERFEEFAGDLDIILTVLTAIGVSVAVLSIINTMLMSVTERMIEFGILKANGWSRQDVLKLITYESAILGLGGGLLGSLFGWIGTLAINSSWPTRANLYASPGLLLFSVCFATALGILGGLYPAIWAMRMMPMDAIRRG